MIRRLSRSAEQAIDRLGREERLDGPSDRLAVVVQRIFGGPRARTILSGTRLGHPAHPALVAVPVGCWVSASVLDATGMDERAARQLTAVGTLAALPAAATGANDWASTSGAERRVGLVHALLNWSAICCYAASWRARRQRGRSAGAAWSVAGLTIASAAAFLGAHLAYALGVGVDTTAFQQFPLEWTDTAADDLAPGEARAVETAGIPLLVLNRDDDVIAMVDRCTHRGGPLHEGTFTADCVTCPWHGSAFAISDGAVVTGPATRPQPLLQVRRQGGRIQVRRAAEARTLRTNPTGR